MISLLLLMISCSGLMVTTKDLYDYSLTSGSEKMFSYPQSKIIDAVYNVLPDIRLKIVKEEKIRDSTYVIYAESGPFLLRQGEVARICIIPLGNESKVLMLTRKKMPKNALGKTQQSYASQLFVGIETYLRKTEIEDLENKYKDLKN